MRSEAEQPLGDHILLDLVGAAVDRRRPRIEVVRCDRCCPGRTDRFIGGGAPQVFGLKGHRIGARHFHQDLGGGLLQFRALDL